MYQNRFILCSAAAVLALAVACSKSSPNPASPTSTQEASGTAAADGSTLKVPAPTPVSPVNGAQPDQLVLTANKVTGKFDSTLNPSYEFRIKTSGGSVVPSCTAVMPPGSGNTVSHTPTCPLDLDAPHTWSVRAVFGGAVGPWSPDTSFKTPVGGYIRGNELYDPLYNGTTVGTRFGGTQFVDGQGIELLGHDSRVSYVLPETLTAGEFSLMVTGIDEGSPGDKTKVMSMQEGSSDITTNDYRFTAEKRGRIYPVPGAMTFRIINGEGSEEDYINDGCRTGKDCPFPVAALSDERWYFWKLTWDNASATMEVREDGPRGRVLYTDRVTTNGHVYRPVPHVIHLGSPVGRGGPQDASIPGAMYKNVWVSSRPRPTFPGE